MKTPINTKPFALTTILVFGLLGSISLAEAADGKAEYANCVSISTAAAIR